MRNLQRNSGTLSTTVFELEDGQKTHKAVIKEIQYHPVSYAVLHIDFAILSDKAPITLNVPIELAGTADCVGVKLGGFIRQTIRTIKVTCLPKYIPEKFVLDVRDLNIAQSKKLSDVVMSEHIRPKAKMDEVAVVVGKKAGAA
jgi:large subunit ribosomal protein L25